MTGVQTCALPIYPGFETEDDTLSDSGSDSDEPDDLSSDNSFEQWLAKGRITWTIKLCVYWGM